MFQFPRFPPHPLCVQGWVSGHHPAGVAPFGYPRIIACPRLPEAFRRLATSFFGPRRQGIHRVPILWISYLVPVRSAAVRLPTPGGFPPTAGSGTAEPTPPGVSPPARRPPARSPRGTPPPTTPPALTSSPSPVNVRDGGAAGIRTPDLRRAKAALSRLSYSPVVVAAGGRSWTRTRGLTLIRGVLSPTELNARGLDSWSVIECVAHCPGRGSDRLDRGVWPGRPPSAGAFAPASAGGPSASPGRHHRPG